jgi:hypothetical protein
MVTTVSRERRRCGCSTAATFASAAQGTTVPDKYASSPTGGRGVRSLDDDHSRRSGSVRWADRNGAARR